MSTLEVTVAELKTLPFPKLEDAAGYIHRLLETMRAKRLAALERSAGILSNEEGAELEQLNKAGR